MLVKALGFAVFVLAFVPLIFGGTVYRMLEKIMTAKLVLVLGYLSIIARDDGLLARHPRRGHRLRPVRHRAAPGRDDRARAPFLAPGRRGHGAGSGPREPGSRTASRPATCSSPRERSRTRYDLRKPRRLPPSVKHAARQPAGPGPRAFAGPTGSSSRPGRTTRSSRPRDRSSTITCWKPIAAGRATRAASETRYESLAAVPEPVRRRGSATCSNTRGSNTSACSATWAGTGGFPASTGRWWSRSSASPGRGGSRNTLFSNYARDKGWGMGARVGAIPSAIGGRTIGLSHTGCVFPARPRQPGPLDDGGCGTSAAIRPSGCLPRSWAWPCPA